MNRIGPTRRQTGTSGVRLIGAALLGIPLWAAIPLPALADTAQSYLAAASSDLAAGKIRDAEIELKKGIAKYPDEPALRVEFGKLHMQLGEFAIAAEDFQTSRQKGASAETVLPLLGQAWLAAGDTERIVRDLQTGAYDSNTNASILALRALALLFRNQVAEAADAMAAAKKLSGDLPEVLIAEARLMLSQGNPGGAEEDIDRVLQQQETNYNGLLAKAMLRMAAQDPDAAIACYDKLLEHWPTVIVPRIARAAILLSLGRDADAQKDVAQLRKTAPKMPQVRLLQAQTLVRAHKTAEAWQALQPAMADLKRDLGAQLLGAELNLQLDNLAQAWSFADTALSLAPGNPIALRLVAQMNIKANAPDKATALLEKALAAAPDDVRTLALLGEVYGRAGRSAEAAKMFERAVRKAPDDATLQFSLGLARLAAGDLATATQPLEAAAAVEIPRASAVLVTLHLSQGRIGDARREAEAYAKREQDSPLSLYLLGQVDLAANDLDKARASFLAALAKDAGFTAASQGLATIDLRLGQARAALALYADLAERQPQDEQIQVDWISALASAGNLRAALQAADVASRRRPDSIAIGVARIDLLARGGYPADALAAAQQMQQSFPGRPEVLAALARVELANGKTEEAVATLRDMAAKAPGAGHFELAKMLLGQGRADEARTALDQAVAHDPGHFAAWRMRVADERRRHGVDAALALTRQAEARSVPMARYLAGDIYLGAKRYDDAAKAYRAAYAAIPAQQGRGVAQKLIESLAAGKHLAEAEQLVAEWQKKHPADDFLAQQLADQLMAAQDGDDAIRAYERVLRINPDNVAALNNLALLTYAKGSGTRALALARHAYGLAPGLAPPADTLGWILVQSGDVKGGLPFLINANGLAKGKDPTIAYHLGAAYVQSGTRDQAVAVLKPLLSVPEFPEQPDARALLRKIGASN